MSDTRTAIDTDTECANCEPFRETCEEHCSLCFSHDGTSVAGTVEECCENGTAILCEPCAERMGARMSCFFHGD
jgi:hypothetical protein